jgi:uncharacterized protein DUF2510
MKRPTCKGKHLLFSRAGGVVGGFHAAAVAGLARQAELIGSMHGQVYLGVLSADDVADVIQHTGIRAHLQKAFEAAVADIGGNNALTFAVDAAQNRADAAVTAGRLPGRAYGDHNDLRGGVARAIQEILVGAPANLRAGAPAAGNAPAAVTPMLTVNGRPQPVPEGPDSLERRGRLFVECVRLLASDPLTSRAAYGHLIGAGSGLEGLVAKIAPLFEREQSLVRWVALRGAIAWLYREILRPSGATRSPQQLAEAMGLAWARGPAGAYELVATEVSGELTGERRNVAIATANITANYLIYYQRIMQMTVPELNADAMCSQLDDDIALECIAWSAVACLRLGVDWQWLANLPEPDALTEIGWYTDPLCGIYQRYWDGWDWTSACRTRNGGEIIEYTIPLRLSRAARRPGGVTGSCGRRR